MNDRIEKEIVIRAPRARVWRALVDQTEFGTWFRVAFPSGSFSEGKEVTGQITQPGWEHIEMTIKVVEVVPEKRLSYEWEAYLPEPGDESPATRTLVTFEIEDAPDGTRLTVVESGFDKVPPSRRERAFRENSQGWTEQMNNIERHVATSG